eukprot:14926881-Alexandrium_andersonii.AAC.1
MGSAVMVAELMSYKTHEIQTDLGFGCPQFMIVHTTRLPVGMLGSGLWHARGGEERSWDQ